jgi:CBS domain-containing protein
MHVPGQEVRLLLAEEIVHVPLVFEEIVRTPIRRVLEGKGEHVETVPIGTSVCTAVQQMNARRIGSLVVIDGNRLAGIITERDVLTRTVAHHRDPATTLVDDVMTRDVVVIAPDITIAEVMMLFTDRRCRHLPVVEGDVLRGMISSGDVTSWLVRDQERTISDLYNYITR